MTLLELNDVVRRFYDGARELTVLDGVSFDVAEGELIGIYGQRRAGKSTLLRVAAGLEEPDDGAVIFDGVNLNGLSISARARLRRRRGIAIAGDGFASCCASEPVLEHVALPLTNDGLTLSESEGLSRPVLERLSLTPISHLRMEALSVSDRVLVELARALVREPRLLLVDEPAILPSPSERRELQSLLHALARDDGIAVVIASEDMSALTGVHRFLTLSEGRLRCTDSRRRVIPFPARGAS